MQGGRRKSGIAAGRLGEDELAENFHDHYPPLDKHEALVAADRCYFCHDAPCVTACPTEIDIPMFIRQISVDNQLGSAKTIFDQNILGGMCARVCPTETLCEQACVREEAEGKPVKIGLLQRYATDAAMSENVQFYDRGKDTGKKVAVVGTGPAGLACAHRLSMHGHSVTMFDARDKSGGLNEFGIAAYKATDNFAQSEVDYVTAIGGIDIQHGKALGNGISLSSLTKDYDAVFLGMGLSGVNELGMEAEGVEDAVDFIERLRQSNDKSNLPVGRNIVVIGGGMTAVDAAVQSKLLGAENVTICYRRGKDQMNASIKEQEHATSAGVSIRHWAQPKELVTEGGTLTGITMEYTEVDGGKLRGTGETFVLEANQVLTAIGQKLTASDLNGGSIELEGGRIKTDETGKTSMANVWAGGDCTNQGEDLTVTAVAQGRDAAEAINQALNS